VLLRNGQTEPGCGPSRATASLARRSARPFRRVVAWEGRERRLATDRWLNPAPASTASWVAVPRSRTSRRHHASGRAAGQAYNGQYVVAIGTMYLGHKDDVEAKSYRMFYE
jgi:hypothetical protein